MWLSLLNYIKKDAWCFKLQWSAEDGDIFIFEMDSSSPVFPPAAVGAMATAPLLL